jgi:hypothetical protein
MAKSSVVQEKEFYVTQINYLNTKPVTVEITKRRDGRLYCSLRGSAEDLSVLPIQVINIAIPFPPPTFSVGIDASIGTLVVAGGSLLPIRPNLSDVLYLLLSQSHFDVVHMFPGWMYRNTITPTTIMIHVFSPYKSQVLLADCFRYEGNQLFLFDKTVSYLVLSQ